MKNELIKLNLSEPAADAIRRNLKIKSQKLSDKIFDNLLFLSETRRDLKKEKRNPAATCLYTGKEFIFTNKRFCFQTVFFDGEKVNSYIETAAPYDPEYLEFARRLAAKEYINSKPVRLFELPPVELVTEIEADANEKFKPANNFDSISVPFFESRTGFAMFRHSTARKTAKIVFSERAGKWLFIEIVE